MSVYADLTATRPAGNGLLLVARPYDHPHAWALALALHKDQLARYGHAESPDCDASAFQPPAGLFLVAYSGHRPAGCGGFRQYGGSEDRTAEIKRMYVRRSHRGRGIGARVLAALESAAQQAGAARIVLETGALNTAACGLYRRFGYAPIPAYSDGRDPEVNRAFARDL
jgi:ribosomal protein S18 acetylase RimI-like enzyme